MSERTYGGPRPFNAHGYDTSHFNIKILCMFLSSLVLLPVITYTICWVLWIFGVSIFGISRNIDNAPISPTRDHYPFPQDVR